MTFLTHTHTSCGPVPTANTAPAARVSLFSLMSLYRQRRALAALDVARLDDLGLTRRQAEAESRRAFWDIPSIGCK